MKIFHRQALFCCETQALSEKSIQEDYPGISDEQVMAIATGNQQIVLTFEGDYGEIIFRYQQPNPPAVIYFREKGNSPTFAGEVLVSLLQANEMTFANRFTVIEKNNIRQRPYKTQ